MKTIIAIAAAASVAATPSTASSPKKPKLIVQITLDQVRADVFEKATPAFSGGLSRLVSEGYWVKRGVVDHAITVSLPGHAALSTGAYPSTHGLTANEWWVERDGRWTWADAGSDPNEKIAGAAERSAPSARSLLAPTIGEAVKAANVEAKAVSLSTGNSVAVAYGGHRSDAAYWFDSGSGVFVTSTYYRAAPHDWVAAFNASDLPAFRKKEWALAVMPEHAALASPDASSVENEGKYATFPHRFETERAADQDEEEAFNSWFAGTPLKDGALIALAEKAVEAERLGADAVPDYLSIAFDSTDSVGHAFGQRSLEYLDALMRIDASLGRFFDFLDRAVGKENYIVALSADHGVADFPETAGKRRIATAEIEQALDRVEEVAASEIGPKSVLANRIARTLETFDFIAAAYTLEDLARISKDPYVYLYRRSFRPDFTPDFPLWTERESRPHHPARYGVVVRFIEGATFDAAPAVHGSPYDYDRLVPILFYGAGVKAGKSGERVATVDVAPTLLELAGLPPLPNADGVSRATQIAKRR
ncbi:MAG: alkaline phosphatase family protein [Pseudomonadota bacterium]